MNYWLGAGLLTLGVGVLFYALGRGASRRIKRNGVQEANSLGVVLLGYLLPLLGLLFMAVGLVQTLA